jgi:hypothetical protein
MGSRCVFCGRKKGMFQQGTVTFTRRGAQRVARREIIRNVKQATDMSWQDAELVVCDWMKMHGYLDARLTTSGADGGVDVVSRRAVAQVKHHLKPVGIRECNVSTASDKQNANVRCFSQQLASALPRSSGRTSMGSGVTGFRRSRG